MPNRIVREELITSRWADCSWMVQAFYIRLLLLACDFGLYEADPEILRGTAFPTQRYIRPSTIKELLRELEKIGLISLYDHGGKA